MSGPTHVVFLRAINVGGRRLPMADLVAACDGLGFAEVATWQATGNLVVTTDPGRDPAALGAAVETALRDRLGLDAPAFVRTAGEVRAIGAATPFTPAQLAPTDGRVQVLLLGARPSDAVVDEVLALVPDGEHVRVDGRELWWLPARGVSDSGFRVAVAERLLGGGTLRTQGAVTRLAARFLGQAQAP